MSLSKPPLRVRLLPVRAFSVDVSAKFLKDAVMAHPWLACPKWKFMSTPRTPRPPSSRSHRRVCGDGRTISGPVSPVSTRVCPLSRPGPSVPSRAVGVRNHIPKHIKQNEIK